MPRCWVQTAASPGGSERAFGVCQLTPQRSFTFTSQLFIGRWCSERDRESPWDLKDLSTALGSPCAVPGTESDGHKQLSAPLGLLAKSWLQTRFSCWPLWKPVLRGRGWYEENGLFKCQLPEKMVDSHPKDQPTVPFVQGFYREGEGKRNRDLAGLWTHPSVLAGPDTDF